MWSEIVKALRAKENLSKEQIRSAMVAILSGEAGEPEIKEFLLGLKEKGETAEEVNELVEVMYEYSTPLSIPDRAVDVVGTGGDGFNTINISTAAAIVTTAAGARVIKHGNRAATSQTGSADLLAELGINIELEPKEVEETVRKIGIGFAFAPKFHPAMRFAAPARKALGVPTIFNILGPLANPAKPKAVAIGVARREMFELVARVIAERGGEGFVFRGDEGLDEISIAGTTSIYQINEGTYRICQFDPTEIGIEKFQIEDIKGGNPKENAAVIERVFQGERNGAREAVLLNAAAAIAAFKGDFFLPVETQLANGYVLAKSAIDSGRASDLVQRWREFSNRFKKSSL